MKKYPKFILSCIVLVALALFTSCQKDDADPAAPTVSLSEDEVSGKSGEEITVTVDITAPGGLKSLVISKTVNLAADNTFGTGGTMTVTPTSSGDNTFQHTFTYELKGDEVDKVVGFNFKAEDNNGKASEKDLTVNTIMSGEQIIATYRWNLKSKFHATAEPPAEGIQDCETDDSFTYNADGTMAVAYGAKACTFDGFNVYTGWTLSEDEKTFTQTYADAFDASKTTTETYTVTTLNKDQLVMEITLDLTAFGLTDNEKFVYTFDASAK